MTSEQDQAPADKTKVNKGKTERQPVWRRVRWWAVVIMVLLVCGAAAAVHYLPVLARPVVQSVAADLGISGLNLQITEIGWRRARLSGVVVGQPDAEEPDLSVGGIDLTYAPMDLVAGRVGTIALSDVILRGRFNEGRLEFGALDPVISPLLGGDSTTQTDITQTDTNSRSLPFDQLTVADGRLFLSTPEGNLDLRLDGALEAAADREDVSVDLDLVLDGDVAKGRATVSADLGGDGQMIKVTGLDARSDHGALPGLVSLERVQAEVRIDPLLRVDASVAGEVTYVSAEDRSFPVRRVQLPVDLTGQFDPSTGAGVVSTTSCMDIAAQTVDEAIWSADDIRLCPDGKRPLVSVDLDGEAFSFEADFDLTPTRFTLGDVLSGEAPQIAATIRRGADGQIIIKSSLAGGDMRLPQQSLQLSNMAASVSLVPGGAGQLGRIDVESLQITDKQAAKRFADVTLSASLSLDGLGEDGIANSRLRGPVSVGSLAGDRLIQGMLTHGLGSGEGSLDFDAAGLTFSEEGLQPQDLAPVLRGIVAAVTGDVAATGRLAWDRSGISRSSARVVLTDLGLQASAARFSGVSGDIEFASLVPFRTRGTQAVSIGVVDAGVPLAGGIALVRVEGGGDVIIENAQWPFAGGQLVLTSGALNTRADVQQAELAALSVNLRELLNLVEMEGLSGEGVLGGAVPIEIRDGSVYVVEAKLEAEPGGIIRYSNASTDAAGQTAEGANIAFQALENFHFEVLSVEIDGPVDGEIALKIVLRGANPDLLEGYPVHLNISTQGAFLELLRRGTVGLRALDVVTGKENLDGLDVERVGPEP